ncbi:apolipoprotein N-acyltransferase [Nonlabens ponticola]|uniref:Apolipoprotein N-acyltransferase n=1 Tax=Nonlabens ponticola TaxID=2496866 RepID=A0A3S9MXB3_9FLAO|nr:apolipoprotein N-acyltransferase [Nonlabens ponticola]AZQ43885.1 apolipoprotein N-acyltransferase [Nonlabens ponticola]
MSTAQLLGLSLISALLLWLGWPTYGFPALLFVAFVPLLLVERSIRVESKKARGWKVLGLAYLTFVLWNYATTGWLYNSTAFGMFFAVLVNSLLMALVFWVYHLFARRSTTGASLTFLVCLWIAFEWMHLHWEFSWPWLNLGNGFSEHTSWIQWYEYTGTFGGSLWIWLVNVVVFLSVLRFRQSKNPASLSRMLKAIALPLFLIASPLLVSLLIAQQELKSIGQVDVVILQPNVDPYDEKYDLENTEFVSRLSDLLPDPASYNPDFIIAPETVLSRSIELSRVPYDRSLNQLKNLTAQYDDASFLGGVSLIDRFREENRVKRQTNYYAAGRFYYDDYNSAFFLSGNRATELYHKSKLVVGVENFPYKGILQPILGDAMIDLGGTVATKTTQEERSVFKSNDSIAVAPIICYESVYGDYVGDYVNNGAQFLAIITNDAWWDNTQGHQQHLSLARLRAVETRRSIARSANTGISAIIDPMGTIQQSLGYEKRGSIKGTIDLYDKITFYNTHGDYIARLASVLGLFTLLFAIFKRGKMKRK